MQIRVRSDVTVSYIFHCSDKILICSINNGVHAGAIKTMSASTAKIAYTVLEQTFNFSLDNLSHQKFEKHP